MPSAYETIAQREAAISAVTFQFIINSGGFREFHLWSVPQGSGGRTFPSGVQERSPGRRSVDKIAEAEAICRHHLSILPA